MAAAEAIGLSCKGRLHHKSGDEPVGQVATIGPERLSFARVNAPLQ